MVTKSRPTHPDLGIKITIVTLLACLLVWMFVNSMKAPIAQKNICELFTHHPQWYWQAKSSESKWGVPVSLQMAIMQKESHFRASAKPSYRGVWGVFPFLHSSSATGYTQALDGTWRSYLRATHKKGASRESFADATDFIGWYVSRLHTLTGIPKTDGFRLYLAYHEGPGGYVAHSYSRKPWLIHLAHKVSWRAHTYRQQLVRCQNHLPTKPWYYFW